MRNHLPDIDFRSIRPLRGKQADGFEELSVQLFQGETEGQGEFFSIEGSGGDGGVEAYRKGSAGVKVAVQSKYFDKLGATQWRQVTESVKTALKNHPELRKYTVAIPLNRNPAQTTKWDALTAGWIKHAQSLGITHAIEFIWWGYSELAGLLTKSRYRNQLVYWLGVPDYSQEWLNAINRANIELLGKRYSPKHHIETESGIRLEAFAWGDQGKKRILKAFLKVTEQWRKVDRREIAKARITPESADLTKIFRRLMLEITSFRWPQSGYPPIRPLNKACRAAIDACNDLEWKLRELNLEEKEKLAKERGGKANFHSGPYESLIHDIRQLEKAVTVLLQATNLCAAADYSKLLLLGEAGTGKSHLISDLVISATNRSQPALLLLGERYLGNGDPWTATIESLGWDHSADDLLAALDQEGMLAGCPALLCIDALNESEHRRLWQSHLIQFAERVSRYPRVKLLVSCRSDFSRITLPEAVRQGSVTSWPFVQHYGYGTEVIEAIEVYFTEFGVRAPYFPPALAEFKNPLFLRVFSEAFAGQDLPTGPLGLHQVMRARIDRLGAQIYKEINCDPEDTRAALKAIARTIAENGGRPIPRKIARVRAAEHFPNPEATRSLYGRLLSNGMLVESVRYSPELVGEDEVVVRFPFERFSDYFIALQILDGIETADQFAALFADGGRLAHLRDYWQYYENRGIARALAILGPERLKIEFAEALPETRVREMVLEDFLESLAWRSSDSFSVFSESLLDEAEGSYMDVLPTYIRLSTIPQHPFNSEFLGAKLAALPLPERELKWTIPVADLSVSGENTILDEFLDWSFRAPTHLIPDEQALLTGRLLLWFCTSNHRALRKRCTIAAIRLLVGRPQVVRRLISELNAVDDPYLLERLYAVASGVAMRLFACEGLTCLAADVYAEVFAGEQVTPNILIRDFACNILEGCLAKGCLPASIAPEAFRPPFRTQWPIIPSEEEVKRFEDDDAWREIVSSVRSEGMGGYGDFGRYVMDAEVHHFSNIPLDEPAPDSTYGEPFRGSTARRWILQRVEELGWTGERFGKYEKHCPVGRQSHDIEELKLERISKKYQWIALREFTGFLADHFWLDQSWKDKRAEFAGAWQLWAREFDPSQRLVDIGVEDVEDDNNERLSHSIYPSPFQDAALCNDRAAWVAQPPEDFASLLRNRQGTPDPGYPWLAIAGHHKWKEPEYERVISGRSGTLKMWANIRSFLVRKEDRTHFVTRASARNLYGHGLDVPEQYRGWIGEYPWSKAFDDLKECCAGLDRRVDDVGVPYTITACSWYNGSTLIPSPQLCEVLCLEWAGEGGMFLNNSGEQVVGHMGGDAADWGRALLIREDSLIAELYAAGLDLVWCIVAERSCWCSETNRHVTESELEVSAVYWLDGGIIEGGLTQNILRKFPSR